FTVIAGLLFSCCPLNTTHQVLAEYRIEVVFLSMAQRSVPGAAAIEFMAPYRRENLSESIQSFGVFAFQRSLVVYGNHMKVNCHFFQITKFIPGRPAPVFRKVSNRRVPMVKNIDGKGLKAIVPVNRSP